MLQNLADLDVDMIKGECRDAGDETPAWGQPLVKSQKGGGTADAAYFHNSLATNRNKRSVESDAATTATRASHNSDRVCNRETLVPLSAELAEQRPTAWWLEALRRADVPCGPINDLRHVFDNAHVRARSAHRHRARGCRSDALVGRRLKMSATPPSYQLPPPRLGENTAQVLRKLPSYNDAVIAEVRGPRGG